LPSGVPLPKKPPVLKTPTRETFASPKSVNSESVPEIGPGVPASKSSVIASPRRSVSAICIRVACAADVASSSPKTKRPTTVARFRAG
jgi:hypothetical protein